MCQTSPKVSSVTASNIHTASASSTASSFTVSTSHTDASFTASASSTTSSSTAFSVTALSPTATTSVTASGVTASASCMAFSPTATTGVTASSVTASSSTASPTEDEDFIELGTPTLLLKRRRTPLSLSRNREARVRQPTTGTSADIQQTAGSSESDMEHSDDSKIFGPDGNASDTDMDDALQEAINASLRPKASFEESLRKWIDSTKKETSPVLLLINRQAILQSTRRAICRKGFQLTCPVKIGFSGEDAEDYGGPRREFFRLLLKELADRLLDNGCLQHNLARLENKEYEFMGKTVVWSILHGGPSFPFLEHHTIAMLFNDTENIQLNIQHAPVEERAMLEKEAETISEETSDWLINLGLSPPFHVDDKKKIIDMSLKQILFYRIHAELCQLREGLRSLKFLDCMIEYKSELETLLCNQPVKMTYEEAKKLMQFVYSEEGTNSKKEELNTVYAFDVFLQDCIESTMEVTFADLLSFWTGTSAVPPLGFEKKLEIHFVNGKDRLPVAHTCEMSLELPRGLTPEELQEKLVKAIQWGGEFHLC